ncbi:MAG: SCO family protein [Caldimonas sp.]
MKIISVVKASCIVVLVSTTALAHSQSVYAIRGPWIDETEKSVQLETLAGTYTVMTMAYGACQKVCSTTVRRVRQLHDLADQRRLSLNFVVIGLDPVADKPADWAAFRVEQRFAAADTHFISGTPAATQRIARSMGVRYWRYGEHTLHDFRIVLVSPAGRIVRAVDHFDDDIASLLP